MRLDERWGKQDRMREEAAERGEGGRGAGSGE